LHLLSILAETGPEGIMTNQNPDFKKFEKRLEGESVVVGEYSLQPVAQVAGWQMKAKGETGQGAGALLRVKPLKVIVSKGDDEPYPVHLTSETEEAMKGIAIGALAIAALCSFIILGANIFRIFKEKE
jgi:ADP-ribosylglycohydrolase